MKPEECGAGDVNWAKVVRGEAAGGGWGEDGSKTPSREMA